MAKIFISYRRVDSNAITSRIYDRVAAAFGKSNVFKDVDNIPLGRDFRGVLRDATTQCQVMIVVIGPDWVNATDASGNRRLDNPNDFVRIEVETGLQRDEIVVIPVLVEGAQMPSAPQLPDSMRELVYNNAFTIHDDPLFHRDMDTLIGAVRGLLGREHLSTRWLALATTLLTIGVIVVVLIVSQGSRGTIGTPTNTATLSPSQQAIANNPTNTPDPTGAPSNTLTATPDPTLAPSNTLVATSDPTVAPSDTPKRTSTRTPTASDTPDFALLAMTYDALQVQTQTEQMVQATASKSVADTATVTQWTPTFTPQITASFQAFLTQRAVGTASRHALDLTATATQAVAILTPTEVASSMSLSAPTNSVQPPFSVPILSIERSGDTVGICTDIAADWSTLVIDFGENERYTLGKELPQSSAGKTGDCWCLQQSQPRFAIPPRCNTENTQMEYRFGDWRNATISFIRAGNLLGVCPAQPDNLEIYQCEIRMDKP